MQSTPPPPAVLFARSADCTLWRPLLESLHVAPLCWGRRAGLLLTLPDMWLSWATKQHGFNSFYSTALLKWTCKLLSHYFSTFTLTLKKKKEKKKGDYTYGSLKPFPLSQSATSSGEESKSRGMAVSDERWMNRGLFRLAFPLVNLWSSSSFTSMAAKSK